MAIVHTDEPSCVAKSSIPITSAMPTGSLPPDSPSRMVPERPPTSRFPRIENMTAGSVGARAAPRIHATVQLKSKSVWANTAITPAVAKVPKIPSTVIGTAAARIRRHPTSMPPSKRMTIRATTPIRSTVRTEMCSESAGTRSDASAAASRKIAGDGMAIRSVSFVERRASEKPVATTRTISPKSMSSVIAPHLFSATREGGRSRPQSLGLGSAATGRRDGRNRGRRGRTSRGATGPRCPRSSRR